MYYFESESLKELARFYHTEYSVITRIIRTFTKENYTMRTDFNKNGNLTEKCL